MQSKAQELARLIAADTSEDGKEHHRLLQDLDLH